jgi:hypothetical protein
VCAVVIMLGRLMKITLGYRLTIRTASAMT